MISAVIVTFNEAKKLDRCLTSLKGFADELVVLDLGSTDKTFEICKKFDVMLFRHEFVPYVEKVRNDATSKATGEWILLLDPDEMIGDALKDKLKQVALNDLYQAVNIPRKNIFFGHWIAHTNWWPDKHVRFFKKGHVKWNDKIHNYPEVSGEILDLETREDLSIRHFGYGTISQFIERQSRYSTIQAENLFSNGIKFSWSDFFIKPIREFLVRFIRHAGFLDGFYGFALTFLMMIYQLQIMIKLWELEKKE